MTKFNLMARGSMIALAADDAAAGAAAATKLQNIKIQGFEFQVPAPYAAGHVLTDNEASALNQTYAENVRNNNAGKIKAAQEAAEKMTPPGEFDIDSINGIKGTAATEGNTKTLRQLIDEAAATYVFGARVARSSEPVDPVEREAHRIAVDVVNTALRDKNIKKTSLAEGQYDAAVKAYASQEGTVKEAKRRVAERAKIGAQTLDLSDLGLAPAAPAEGEATQQAAE